MPAALPWRPKGPEPRPCLSYHHGAKPSAAMQWTDEGIVLGVKRHGEANAILELLTREHGRHLGLVRGGAGSRLRPVLQPGNRISATWRAIS